MEIYRDSYGIPHVQASCERDAFFAQGFATAQDRLWHMEYDRRRGAGRWSEAVGIAGLEQDKLMRKFRLEASARADYQTVDDQTRMMLDAYALGVNAFIESTDAPPIEYRITGLEPEPWQPWDGLVVFKARHILMGVFESKLWRAEMVRHLGPDRAAKLFPGYQPGQMVILPPGALYAGPLADGLAELTKQAAALNYLNENDAGSNNWVISGDRTASGKPLLAGDPHRALDTPSVYYQNQVSCPEFDVVGLSFPGLPGFPHFGHNASVAWCVTHTGADYQDLYIERFKEDDPQYYLDRGQWRRAEVHRQKIKVKNSDDVDLPVWVTHHGPLISGSPDAGAGVAFKYTATEMGSGWPHVLRDMLLSKNVDQLVESMRDWVDPSNSFVFADVHGNIGYLCRGRIPIRSTANAWLPVPGWTGEHEWQGQILFDEMPRSVNPKEGYIVTANNRPVGEDYPHHIVIDSAPGFRAQGVTDALRSLDKPTAADMAKVHQQKVAIPALAYIKLLKRTEPLDEMSARAKKKLLTWSGSMDADRVEPTIYSACRDELLKELFQHNLGPELAAEAWNPSHRGLGSFANRFKAQMAESMSTDDLRLLPPGQDWPSMLAQALARGVAALSERLGDDLEEWRWERLHQARPSHSLSAAYPDLAGLLDPPPIPVSGDGDTPLAGSYSPADPATVTGMSVARYAYDLADWDSSLWTVPLGSSGHPASKHYHDQSENWRQVRMVPMLYSWDRIIADSETHQRLEPA